MVQLDRRARPRARIHGQALLQQRHELRRRLGEARRAGRESDERVAVHVDVAIRGQLQDRGRVRARRAPAKGLHDARRQREHIGGRVHAVLPRRLGSRVLQVRNQREPLRGARIGSILEERHVDGAEARGRIRPGERLREAEARKFPLPGGREVDVLRRHREVDHSLVRELQRLQELCVAAAHFDLQHLPRRQRDLPLGADVLAGAKAVPEAADHGFRHERDVLLGLLEHFQHFQSAEVVDLFQRSQLPAENSQLLVRLRLLHGLQEVFVEEEDGAASAVLLMARLEDLPCHVMAARRARVVKIHIEALRDLVPHGPSERSFATPLELYITASSR
mmetsp:Transcript_9069/g.34221  ORF Transcript_9069/g.34221 Transcript_9069/m.34221 type:complete len:335 (+) Transcript_9069:3-1007(+)